MLYFNCKDSSLPSALIRSETESRSVRARSYLFANIKLLVFPVDHPPFSIAPNKVTAINVAKDVDFVFIRLARLDSSPLACLPPLLSWRSEFAERFIIAELLLGRVGRQLRGRECIHVEGIG